MQTKTNCILTGMVQLHKRLPDIIKLEYLERQVETTFSELSHKLTRRLADLITNVAVTSARAPGERLDVTAQLHHFEGWEDNISTAFTLALQLHLGHACSPLRYHYSMPVLDQAFSHEKMAAVASDGTAGQGEEGRKVWLSLRPMIESWNEKTDVGSHVVVAKALVILN